MCWDPACLLQVYDQRDTFVLLEDKHPTLWKKVQLQVQAAALEKQMQDAAEQQARREQQQPWPQLQRGRHGHLKFAESLEAERSAAGEHEALSWQEQELLSPRPEQQQDPAAPEHLLEQIMATVGLDASVAAAHAATSTLSASAPAAAAAEAPVPAALARAVQQAAELGRSHDAARLVERVIALCLATMAAHPKEYMSKYLPAVRDAAAAQALRGLPLDAAVVRILEAAELLREQQLSERQLRAQLDAAALAAAAEAGLLEEMVGHLRQLAAAQGGLVASVARARAARDELVAPLELWEAEQALQRQQQWDDQQQ